MLGNSPGGLFAGMQAASRPVELMLRPGSMELKLIAYEDHTHNAATGKKDKKKGKKGKNK